MKELIRKILREGKDIERIMRNEKEIPKRVPAILEFINEKYGGGVRAESDTKSVYFGSDSYRGLCKEIKVYVEDEDLNPSEVKHELWDDIKNFFGIDMSLYGSCLDLTVFKKQWTKV